MKIFVFILFLSVAIGFGTAQDNNGCRDFCEDRCIPLGEVACGQLIIDTVNDPGGEKCRCQNRCLNRFPSWRIRCDVDTDCVAPLRCVGANDNNQGRCQPGKCDGDDECADYCEDRCDGKTFRQCIQRTRRNCDCQDSCLAGYDEHDSPCTSNNDCDRTRTICIDGTCRPSNCNQPTTCDDICIACDDKSVNECADFILADTDNRCECTDNCLRRYDAYRASCDTDNDCVFPLICRGDKCVADDDCVFVSTTTTTTTEAPPRCYGESVCACEDDGICPDDTYCIEGQCRPEVPCDPCGDEPDCGDCGHYSRCENDVCCPECYRETYKSCSTENDYRCCPGNTCTAISTSECDIEICLPDEPDCPFCQDCHIESCPYFDAHECHFGVGYDYCGCCQYCLRGPGEYCGGPHDFYGRCGDGFYCQKFGNYWWSVGICVC